MSALPALGARDDADEGPDSSFPSIWTFIAFDCTSFGVFFCVFMSERRHAAALYDASAHLLDVRLGLANTLILITSSYLVALAAAAARRGDLPATRRLLSGGILVGAGFAVLKLAEYTAKIADGITPQTNAFFGYYFALTGLHFLHYAAGMVVLLVLLRRARRATAAHAGLQHSVLSGGIFWHMVDLLWVFLFPMLYLIGAVR